MQHYYIHSHSTLNITQPLLFILFAINDALALEVV